MRHIALAVLMTCTSLGCATTSPTTSVPATSFDVKKALRELTLRVSQLEADVALIQSTPKDSLGPCNPNDPYCCDEKTTDCD